MPLSSPNNDVPRLLADLEAATAALERVRAAIEPNTAECYASRYVTDPHDRHIVRDFAAHLRSLLGSPTGKRAGATGS